MGRFISCEINGQYEIVWKYGFGVQDSEMYRINTELGIGEYHRIRYLSNWEHEKDNDETGLGYKYLSRDEPASDDILILNRSDVKKLQIQLKFLKNSAQLNQDKWFIAMIESTINFIIDHPEQDKFILEGEIL
ncbi:MAG: hypothetical protein WBA13_21930 [Microcoleaceae cyanobacterium]